VAGLTGLFGPPERVRGHGATTGGSGGRHGRGSWRKLSFFSLLLAAASRVANLHLGRIALTQLGELRGRNKQTE